MENSGDWLYIVFLAVAAVSSLFSSKKKKKRPTEILGQPDTEVITSDQSTPQKGFWELLEDAKKEFNRELKPQTTEKKKQNKKQKAPAPKPFLSAEAEIQQSSIFAASSGPTIEEEHSIMQDIEFKNTSDLRKAVIYAEILNRKY